MPFSIRKQRCKKADGSKGNYVVYRTDTGKKVSCHSTRAKAEAAMRARIAGSEDLSLDIREEIKKDMDNIEEKL